MQEPRRITMDNLTHGLLGLAVAAMRRPDAHGSPSATDKAVILACVTAAELPDLDSLWPAPNEVINALQAHRGFSHSLLFAPVVALVATVAARLIFRGGRFRPIYGYSLAAVIFAHLIPDLWTGWGTRVLIPLSYQRFSWDMTMVVDPFVTIPLLIGAAWALFLRDRWRQAVLGGALITLVYLLGRGAAYSVLQTRLTAAFPTASKVQVFPTWLGLTTWRYVAVLPSEYLAGSVTLTGEPQVEKRKPVPPPDVLPPAMRAIPTVREALAWARFPLISAAATQGGGTEIRISDLRYHLRGEPTLTFVLQIGADRTVQGARLDRGGTASELLERWRGR
jgi:inner membrane protein